MNEKATWRAGAATVVGGGLDALLILAALERIEEKLAVIHEKIQSRKRRRYGTSGPCGSTEARI